MYKLKNTNGRVNALLRTGKDFVKNNLSVSAAQHMLAEFAQSLSGARVEVFQRPW